MTPGWRLRLVEDRLSGGGWLALPEANRVLYLRAGDLLVTHGGQALRVAAGGAWFGASACSLMTEGRGATVLRYELQAADGPPPPDWPGVTSQTLLEHALVLDSAQPYLMRCDRVEFAPGGEALPHRHQGGGIRYLLTGELEVRIGKEGPRQLKPGDAWFESGQEPVHALASKTAPTSFVRVAVLPRAIRGLSSIVYVNPAHATATPRTYTVYVDEPIKIG